MTARWLVPFLVACSSPAAQPPDAALDAPPPPPDAAPIYEPLVIPDLGGPVLETPAIVTVTWPSDPLAAELHAFDDWYVHSATWTQTLAQYRIKAGAASTTWALATAAPATIDDAELQVMLRDAIEHGTVPHTASSLYVFYPPATTTVTETFGPMVYRSCEAFEGYHGTTSLTDGTHVFYAVAARCPPPSGLTELDGVTWAASHELAEAVTDPDTALPAWRIPYDPAVHWRTPYGGEVGDLCLGYPLHIENHVVSALHSNEAATGGQRTCVPAPPGPMFAATSTPHEVAIAAGHDGDAMISIVAPVAGAGNLALSLYSISGGLTLSPASRTVKVGDQVPVHIAAAASAPAGPYVVVMNLADTGYRNITYLIVNVQ